MLRSAAASRDQQVRKRGNDGKPTPETALPNRGRRFYLHTESPLRVAGFAYLRSVGSVARKRHADPAQDNWSWCSSRTRKPN